MDKNKKFIFKKRGSILSQLSKSNNSLPKVQAKIGEIILNNPSEAIKMSISQVAQEARVKSGALIVNFCWRLGFESFSDFTTNLAAEISGNMSCRMYEDTNVDDDIETTKNKILPGSIKKLDNNLHFTNPEVLQRATYVDVCINKNNKEVNYRTDAMVLRIVKLAVIDTIFTVLALRKRGDDLNKLLKAGLSYPYFKILREAAIAAIV
jgi:DNA-binding MurR/RpiR family transcriptional regulator